MISMINMQVTEQEQKVLLILRGIEYGELRIVRQTAVITQVIKQESIKT